jgi:YesN/AraC family two-component response regulator
MPTKRVLIVDDEHLTRASLADFLDNEGYDTTTASDGESAIQLHQKQPFDICIVDIRMPTMGGVDVILTLHQITPNCRFIIYTGSPQFVLPPVLERMSLSEHDIVRKPVMDMGVFMPLVDAGTDS